LAVGAAALVLLPSAAVAQSVNIDLGGEGSTAARIVQLVALLTVLSLAPSILIMVTSFTRIIVVLSVLRSAIGAQQAPPNMVMISLALFLTAFVMAPTLERAYDNGVAPLLAEEIDTAEAFTRTMEPVREFMLENVRERDLTLFMDLGKVGTLASPSDTPLSVLVPAFMISELRRAFEIGFLLFVPFLIID